MKPLRTLSLSAVLTLSFLHPNTSSASWRTIICEAALIHGQKANIGKPMREENLFLAHRHLRQFKEDILGVESARGHVHSRIALSSEERFSPLSKARVVQQISGIEVDFRHERGYAVEGLSQEDASRRELVQLAVVRKGEKEIGEYAQGFLKTYEKVEQDLDASTTQEEFPISTAKVDRTLDLYNSLLMLGGAVIGAAWPPLFDEPPFGKWIEPFVYFLTATTFGPEVLARAMLRWDQYMRSDFQRLQEGRTGWYYRTRHAHLPQKVVETLLAAGAILPPAGDAFYMEHKALWIQRLWNLRRSSDSIRGDTHVWMDELYYRDERRNEPVLVVYLRTSRQKPFYPAPAPQHENEAEAIRLGRLAPIPIRVGN